MDFEEHLLRRVLGRVPIAEKPEDEPIDTIEVLLEKRGEGLGIASTDTRQVQYGRTLLLCPITNLIRHAVSMGT
jgi:hypothetical protein